MSLTLFNHRQVNSIGNMKINHRWNYKRFFLSVICHLYRGKCQRNNAGKYFLFSVFFSPINSSVIIIQTEWTAKEKSFTISFLTDSNRS